MKVCLTSLCLLALSCIDKIELTSPLTSVPVLIIDGKLVQSGNSNSIYVKTVIGSMSEDASKPVRVKEVKVIDEKGNQALLTDLFSGEWIMKDNPSYPIEIGVKYKISVKSFDDEEYESAFMQLTSTPSIKKVTLDWQSTQSSKGELKAFVKSNIPNKLSHKIFKWEVIESYKYTDQIWGQEPGKLCYVINKVDKLDVAMLDVRKSIDNDEFNFLVTTRPVNYKFSEGYYLTVIQETIDQKTFEYFGAYNNLVKRDGNIYEAPAGRIPSNMSNINSNGKQALGFFYAVSQDTSRIYIDPSYLDNPKRECPTPPSETKICPIVSCCDCLRLNGSSLDKPYFWK